MAIVLLTGATGFLGLPTAAALVARGHDVHGATRQLRGAGTARTGITLHQADLLQHKDRRALLEAVRPDALLHLAWETEHGHFWTSPKNNEWVAASTDLVALFRAAGGTRLVITGTCAEYDWTDPALRTKPCTERQTPTQPHTPYGRARVSLYRWLEAEAGSLSQAWARIFFPFGPGEDERRLIPSVARSLLIGREAAIGPGTVVRDFISVHDAGAALAALLDSAVQGPVNIGSGQGRSIASVARRLAELSGRPELLRIGALPPRPDDPPHLVADISRLAEEVGFMPRRDFDADLANTLDWWATRRSTLPSIRGLVH